MKIPKLKYPFVIVVWDDAESNDSWQELNEHKELKPTLALTAGFLVKENKDYVLIADSYFLEEDSKIISNTTKIPKGMIKELHEVQITKKRIKKENNINEIPQES